MGYDVPITLLSMLIAVVVSGFALFIVTRLTVSNRNLAVGGVLMGLGICAMHYTGMAAMEMSPPIRYDPWLFAASVAIAIVAALAALWIAFHLRANENWMIYAKLGSAVIMGFAITGMHYTGMAAAHFAPDTVCLTGASVDNSWMAGTIAAFTFVILCVTLCSPCTTRGWPRGRRAWPLRSGGERGAAAHGAARPLTRLPNRLLLEDRLEPGDRARAARAQRLRRALRRPRPLQGGQRHARPLRGRRAAERRGRAAPVGRARGRHGVAPGRRRVRGAAARRSSQARRRREGRREGPGGARPALPGARSTSSCHAEHRHQPVPAARPATRRRSSRTPTRRCTA